MENNFIKIQKWLYPISFLYGIGVNFRNKLFDCGFLHSRNFDIPIISIGNITVGGTGKTPHTEYLIRLLKKEYKVAVLSRGYKRKSKGFVLAEVNTPTTIIGDEPYQMKQKYPDIYMAVDKDRCHGIEQLCNKNTTQRPEVILLDDAFQHRYVQPGINILLVDFNRLICNDTLLPAGRLREPVRQKCRANVVIVTKCPPDIKPVDHRVLSKQLNLFPYQKLFFTSFRYKKLIPMFTASKKTTINLEHLESDDKIILLTGIASPKQMLQDLDNYTNQIEPFIFSDHHEFTRKDIDELKERFDSIKSNKKIIITTEKDAARLIHHPYLHESLKPFIYSLPIEVYFLQNEAERFNEYILEYVKRSNINSIKNKSLTI